jgi:hypothetical protein
VSDAICWEAKFSITGATLGHTLEHWTDGDLLDAVWGSRASSIYDVVATQRGPMPPKTMGS